MTKWCQIFKRLDDMEDEDIENARQEEDTFSINSKRFVLVSILFPKCNPLCKFGVLRTSLVFNRA